MAKLPTKPFGRLANAGKPRRTVKAVPAGRVQPGAVAATLSSANIDGLATVSDGTAEKEGSTAAQVEARRLFMETARRKFRLSADAESELRRDMLADLRFYNSEQWPENILAARILDNKVCLTINRLPQFVRQVVNQGRQSRPAIQVNPVDNGADPDTAEVYQGICRSIERQSRAHIAYSTASEHQAIMGRGWWRVIAEYASDDAMEQEIRIKRIMDQFTVYPDPACSEPDHSDATFTFIVERIGKEEFAARYGAENAVSAADFQSLGDDSPLWMNDHGVQVAEYFYKENIKATIADVLVTTTQGPTRIVMDASAIAPDDRKPTADNPTPRVIVLKERETVRRQVKWALINGITILDGNADKTAGRDLPGSYIPVVPVIGEELVVNGRRNLRGMVRDAISPQRAYNFWISAITEKLALSTKAPVVVAVGQIEGLEAKWNTSHLRNYPYLEYNPIDVGGLLVPPPQRASYDPDISPALQMTMQADRDLKAVIGMFDASQDRSPETSGKAILARQRQGEEGTSHFLDNLSRSIEHTGRILVEWIPVYYDKPRMLRILGLDDQPRDVLVHAGNPQAAQQMLQSDSALAKNIKSGQPFDLSIGRYDVSISVGPSYQSRRQESVESLIQLVQAYPNLLPVVGDILVGNMDWPGARQLAERMKRMVPPEVKDPEDGQPEIPPEVQQQLAGLQQQMKMAMAALSEKDDIIRSKAQELQAKKEIATLEIQSQERLERIKEANERARQEAQINADKAMALLEARLQEISLRLTHAHADKLAAAPPAHPSESINYKDTPEDVKRQLEASAGLKPSTLPPPPKAPAAKPKPQPRA